ncbi:phosphotransferase, partial [Candidatus Bipolaricaulota bacterium]|nr:phosphotransferase [Candidatus Bipolaricaulota bacterium]
IEQERWVRWFAEEISSPPPDRFIEPETGPRPDVFEYLENLGYPADRVEGIERIRGLTNENYSIRVNGEELVVRIASPNAARLGIDRFAERTVMRAAEVTGLGPQIVHYSLPHGHLVTRRIRAEPFEETPEVYRSEKTLERVVAAVKRIHALPPIEHRFDPFARIERILEEAEQRDLHRPASLPRLIAHMQRIRARWGESTGRDRTLCHNDLFAGNILNTDPIRIVDWEFVGMGDPYFDLATLVVSCGESAPLPRPFQDTILEAYAGRIDREGRTRLVDMVFMVRLHAGCWGLAQQLAERPLPVDAGFTYVEYTDDVLHALDNGVG